MSSASGDAIGFVMWPGPPIASVPEHTPCDGSKCPGALICRFRGSAYARAYTSLQTPSNCVVPLRFPSGYVWHLIRNHTELSFTTMVSIRRNDQTSSNSINSANQPTATDHIAATDQPTTPRTNRPQRHQQPPTDPNRQPPKPPPNTRCGPPQSSRDGPQPMLQHPPTSQPHAFIRIRTRIRRRIRYLAASAASAALAALTLA